MPDDLKLLFNGLKKLGESSLTVDQLSDKVKKSVKIHKDHAKRN